MKKQKQYKYVHFCIPKICPICSVLLDHFNKYIPLTSEEGHSTIVIGRYYAPDISEGLFHSGKKWKLDYTYPRHLYYIAPTTWTCVGNVFAEKSTLKIAVSCFVCDCV